MAFKSQSLFITVLAPITKLKKFHIVWEEITMAVNSAERLFAWQLGARSICEPEHFLLMGGQKEGTEGKPPFPRVNRRHPGILPVASVLTRFQQHRDQRHFHW